MGGCGIMLDMYVGENNMDNNAYKIGRAREVYV